MAKNINVRDVTAGLLLLVLTACGLYLNLDHTVGTASRMGPGYMPLVVFLALGGLGAAVLVTGFFGEPAAIEDIAWRKVALIVASLVAFGLLLEDLGMAVATIVLVVLSGLADSDQTPKGIAALTVALVAICWVVFAWGLRINVPFLPPFLTNG